MKTITFRGKEYLLVDTVENGKKNVLIRKDYKEIFEVAGLDIDGSPLRVEEDTIIDIETGDVVGFYGVDTTFTISNN